MPPKVAISLLAATIFKQSNTSIAENLDADL